jgi:hypothetical protein
LPETVEPIPISPLPRIASPEGSHPKQPEPVTELDPVELMRRLHVEDATAAAEAEAELARRGFTAVHLELARRLFHPDLRQRKELVRRLPGLQSVDTVPWLLWLCRDAHRDVRLSAIAILATTTDPALLEQVEQIARHDPDPQIQRQAERLARQRAGRRF